jgi:hypothetical protein
VTAPLDQPVRWRDVLVAGMAAVHDITVTASCAAPLTCDCSEWVCPDGTHLWLTPTAAQAATWAHDGVVS